MAMSVGKLIACVLVMWLLVVLMISGPLFHSGEPDEQVLARLTRAVAELESLKQQNEELRALLNSIKDPSKREQQVQEPAVVIPPIQTATTSSSGVPSKEYEVLRRKVINGVQELWYYARAQLKKLRKSLGPEAQKTVDAIVEDISVYKRTIHIDLDEMRKADGYEKWREQESKAIGDLVQKRLTKLQNPKACGSAKRLLCRLNKGCGYGCQIHHATYCLIMAYGTRRTMVLHSKGWRYAAGGWETVFKPVSNSCVEETGGTRATWSGNDDGADVLEVPIIDSIQPRPKYLPLAVPKDLSERLIRLVGDPALWWISQAIRFLMRPQPEIQQYLAKAEKDMDFKGPVVGVHVRRTDKIGTEADFHSIEEYMEFVDDYFAKLELQTPGVKRRVYLATDDPKLLGEARQKYPHYQFYGDSQVAKTASLGNRYTSESLRGIILDIHMLSKCDFLSCTFSSQVCRMAYEIMQLSHVDASKRFQSLDDIYYFGGQKDHSQVAAYDHTARGASEMDIRKGDILGIAGNHWDGYSKGVNRRTGKQGLYPSFKAVEKVDVVDFPPYEDDDDGHRNEVK